MARTWSLREIARESGRPVGHVAAMARAGLIPGYRSSGRKSARVPDEIASDVITVLRHGVLAARFAVLIREDPTTAREGAEALARLVHAAESAGEEATPAA